MDTRKTVAKTIVVFAQDLFFAVRLSDALHAMGYNGVTVQDVSELQGRLTGECPLMIILDLQMRGVQVQAVVSAARHAAPGRAIPILAFGGLADVKRRAEAVAAGCQRVVSRTMIATELPMLVKSILRA